MAKVLIGNFKGIKGDTGATGATGSTGATGATGTRGTKWFAGTGITGISTTPTIFSSSGVTSALIDDCYLNTTTGNTYRCMVGGNAATAKWAYIANLKGIKGEDGANYTHPSEHPPSIIKQDANNRFVTDEEKTKWNNKVTKSVTKTVTLSAASWTGSTMPYSYNLSLAEATATNNMELNPPTNLTLAQYNVMADASIIGGTQAVGRITLLAYGKKPTIDLPIVVTVRGD